MKPEFRSALGGAMDRLRHADVAGATAAIQQALRGASVPATEQGNQPARRGLGDVLRALQQARPAPSRASAPPPASQDADPNLTWRSHRSPSGALNYRLYIPADRNRELALVVMLHGCTQDPDDFIRGTGMNRLAEEFGLVVAYPHQPRSANAQGCWNWFDVRHQQHGSGEPAMLASLALALAGEFGIASPRIFAAGLSAGGAMAEVLAQTYPEVFSAVGIHSGLPYRAAKDVMSAFAAMKGSAKAPVEAKSSVTTGRCRRIVFHGSADATVNASNGEDIFEGMQTHHAGSAVVISDMQIGGRKVTRKVLAKGADAPAEHWFVHGAGHAWSGGDATGSFTDATGPAASREMVRFFLG